MEVEKPQEPSSSSSSSSTCEHRLLLSICNTQSLAALQEAVLASRAHKGRATFASLNAVPSLLPLFSSFLQPSHTSSNPEALLLLLKLLRNLCAGDSCNQQAFVGGAGEQALASLLRSLRSRLGSEGHGDGGSRSSSMQLLIVAVQLLGNLSAGGGDCAEAVWEEFSPSLFSDFATIEQDKVLDALCMALYFCCCCHGNESRFIRLCHEEEGYPPLIRVLLLSVMNCAAAGYWMQLLLLNTCLFQPFLPVLFNTLEAPSPEQGTGDTFSSEQVFLLRTLFSMLNEEFEAYSGKFDSHMPVVAESLSFIGEIIRQASERAKGTCDFSMKLPTGILSIDALGYAIGIVRILSAWEFDAENASDIMMSSVHSSIVALLSSCGMIKLCLKLLKEMGPPELIRKFIQQQVNKSTDISALVSDTEQSVASNISYEGYRRDLVAIIGNAAYQNKEVQDEIRQMGGLCLILQQCVIDKENPFLREWGLWAVRNLLEGNEENQREVMELEFQGSYDPAELAQAGLTVEINQETNHPRLANISTRCMASDT